jgi:alanine dehydrogenase
MLIGVPREIKAQEFRVGMTPAGVRELASAGHSVLVENDAGAAIGLTDDLYRAAGATMMETPEQLFAEADMIVKVKEPQPQECQQLRPDQILFTYLHLAADPKQAELLMASGATCIAYETVTSSQGGLPLLAPMSVVAGRLSVQAGAHHMEIHQGSNGTLLGGVPGVEPGKVLVIGGGMVGSSAIRVALGMGAEVTVVDRSINRAIPGTTSHGLFHDGGDRAACLRGRPHHWRRADTRCFGTQTYCARTTGTPQARHSDG